MWLIRILVQVRLPTYASLDLRLFFIIKREYCGSYSLLISQLVHDPGHSKENCGLFSRFQVTLMCELWTLSNEQGVKFCRTNCAWNGLGFGHGVKDGSELRWRFPEHRPFGVFFFFLILVTYSLHCTMQLIFQL